VEQHKQLLAVRAMLQRKDLRVLAGVGARGVVGAVAGAGAAAGSVRFPQNLTHLIMRVKTKRQNAPLPLLLHLACLPRHLLQQLWVV
jgi:hypothetical protein